MRFLSWKRIVVLGLLAVLVSVIVACGDDDGEAASQPTSTASETTTGSFIRDYAHADRRTCRPL